MTSAEIGLNAFELGSFFVNGTLADAGFAECAASGTGFVGQMYVQYLTPRGKTNVPRVVLIHGSGHTGKSYETTPDGREGWFTYFARRGIATYVVDLPGRGRSGFDVNAVNAAALHPQSRYVGAEIKGFTREAAWTIFRFGPAFGVASAGTQFPVTAADQYFMQLVPDGEAWLATPQQVLALGKLLELIGPSVLVVHSLSGPDGIDAALARPDLVKALVSIEPVWCDLTRETAARFAASQIHLLTLFGDFSNSESVAENYWTGRRRACQDACDQVRAAGGRADCIYLPDWGIRGNSHMLMMDANNAAIADFVLEWLQF